MTDLRSFVDRVLCLKAEQDTLAGDIREVYAEAKCARLDKTAIGQVVAHLRKRAKDPSGVEFKSIKFEAYLHEYDRGTELALAHAHEDQLPPHDADGVLIEETRSRDKAVEGEAAPASDAVETRAVSEHGNKSTASHVGEGASVLSPPVPPIVASSPFPATIAGDASGFPPGSLEASPLPIDELPDLPAFLDRRARAA